MGKTILIFVMSIFVGLYRATKGGFMGSMAGLNVLLLTTKGRKSGEERTTPLGFFEDNGDYVIIASYAGNPTNPAWYHNLKANPDTTIEIKDKVLQVKAEVAGPDDRNRLWSHLAKMSPQYEGYETKTSRVIPMVRLHPVG